VQRNQKIRDTLTSLLLEKHPDTTFIGKAMRGFTFLGYFLTPLAISVAQSAVDNMKQRIARLYEQGAGKTDIGRYVVRFGCGGVDKFSRLIARSPRMCVGGQRGLLLGYMTVIATVAAFRLSYMTGFPHESAAEIINSASFVLS